MKNISLNKRIILIIGSIVLLTTLFVKISMDINADNVQPLNLPGPELKVGRYYLDGDVSQYYVEVTKEGTIQLKDMDYLEYASKDQLSTKGFSENQISEHDKAVQEYAEELSKAYTYKTVYYPGIKQTAILTSWTEDENGCIGGTGYDYIDENTISRGDDMKFIFVSSDESSENIIGPDKNTTSID